MALESSNRIVCLTGGESTGKTTIARQLGQAAAAVVVDEAARDYIAARKLGPGRYQPEDLLAIAELQLAAEVRACAATPALVICDTDLLVLKIWWQRTFAQPTTALDRLLHSQLPRRYLLCAPDIPWQFDPLRESAAIRWQLFADHFGELRRLNAEFAIIAGTGAERLDKARSQLQLWQHAVG